MTTSYADTNCKQPPMIVATTATDLLDATDPKAVEVVNPASTSPVLLVCEHAGRCIPAALGDMGLTADAIDQHIAYDIGAEMLARSLAQRLGCTLILQRYSRLVIDCNRPPGSLTSIPAISDDIPIPANDPLSVADRRRRESAIFEPYAHTCQRAVSRPGLRLALSIHSFTPRMNGIDRPWDISLLYRHPASHGDTLLSLCREFWPELIVGDNEPYTIEDDSDWFVPVCAEPNGLAHSLIEVRNDHLQSHGHCQSWASRLQKLVVEYLQAPTQ